MSRSKTRRETTVRLELASADIEQLIALAHFYERNMGFMRYVIRVTGSKEVRTKLRFVREESFWLERLAEDLRPEAEGMRSHVDLKPRAFVAFWGRILASLNTRRSRRKLKGNALAEREALADVFAAAARRLDAAEPTALQREMRTRRAREIEWMQLALAARPEP